jgi:hypothetical protein
VSRGSLTAVDVVKTLEETFTEVHVADGVDSFGELNGTRKLAVPVAPVVLDAFHVPLVDNDNDFFTIRAVNLFKKLFVLLINKDSLEMGEESCAGLSVPINLVLVQTFLCEGSGAHQGDLTSVVYVLLDPLCVTPLVSPRKVVESIHSGLVSKLLSSGVIEFCSHKFNSSTD